VHGFKGATSHFLLNELERRKPKVKTHLVWIGAQKEPGVTSRTWRWVDGECTASYIKMHAIFMYLFIFKGVTKRYGTNFRTHSSHLEVEIMLYEHGSGNALFPC